MGVISGLVMVMSECVSVLILILSVPSVLPIQTEAQPQPNLPLQVLRTRQSA